ncbi:hypothetical protein [Streptomyces sp. NPDC020983]|uniref:hypothetical protein n=1 Tax=Streptomyces sp. NPDC020983 TaxID=3365106 RepID=UPI0037879988
MSAPLSEHLRSAIAAALTHCQPATDEDVRRAVSDALSVGGHSHTPLIHERLMRAERHVPAIVRRLLDAEARVAELEAPAAKVAEFVAERAEYITAIRNCHPDNARDYYRWQGHAEARRRLARDLGLPVAWPAEDGEC